MINRIGLWAAGVALTALAVASSHSASAQDAARLSALQSEIEALRKENAALRARARLGSNSAAPRERGVRPEVSGQSRPAPLPPTDAFAADRPAGPAYKAPVIAASSGWAGGYVGVTAGYLWGRDTWSSNRTDPARLNCEFNVPPCGPQSFKLSGLALGGLAGVNVQQGHWVFGPEFDISAVRADGRLTYSVNQNSQVSRITESLRWNAHARLRLGHDFGHWLPFVAAGVALTNAKFELVPMNQIQPPDSFDVYRVGFSVGGGVDYRWSRNSIFRLEYLYDQYGRTFLSTNNEISGNQNFGNLHTQIVRGAAIWQFDSPANATVSVSSLVTKAHPAATVGPWAGAYVGVGVGHLRGGDTWSSLETDPANNICGIVAPPCGPQSFKLSGWTFGALVGANFQQGNLVIGPEFDINWVNADGTLTYPSGPNVEVLRVSESIRWNAHARMRFGYAFGHWLPFVAGGAALAQTKIEMVSDSPTPRTGSTNIYRIGFSVGGGLDYMVSPNAVIRLEYLYDQYGNTARPAIAQVIPDQETFGNLHTHTLRGAAMWKFGGPAVAAAASPAVLPPWAGVYAGVSAGYLWGRDAWSSENTSPAAFNCALQGPPPCDQQPFNLSGGSFGALVGANFQQGNWVIGPELDINRVSANGALAYPPGLGLAVVRVSEDIRWTAHARIRAGYAFGNWLPFIAGGSALAKAKFELVRDNANQTVEKSGDIYRVGFSAGGGLDYMILHNAVLRAEYLYDQYGNTNFGINSTGFSGQQTFGSLHTHTLRAAGMWKFN